MKNTLRVTKRLRAMRKVHRQQTAPPGVRTTLLGRSRSGAALWFIRSPRRRGRGAGAVPDHQGVLHVTPNCMSLDELDGYINGFRTIRRHPSSSPARLRHDHGPCVGITVHLRPFVILSGQLCPHLLSGGRRLGRSRFHALGAAVSLFVEFDLDARQSLFGPSRRRPRPRNRLADLYTAKGFEDADFRISGMQPCLQEHFSPGGCLSLRDSQQDRALMACLHVPL